MTARIRFLFLLILSIILQAAFIPAHFPDAFKPDLMIILIVYMGLAENAKWGGCGSFLLGLVHDSMSGIYFGLSGFSYLLIFILLRAVSHRLYTESRSVMVLAVLLATLINGLVILLLLTVFSLATGLYSAILSNMAPQGLINAVIAYLSFRILPLRKREEIT